MGKKTCAVIAVAAAVIAAWPAFAKVEGEDYEVGNAFVRTFADDFTDAYAGSILLLSGNGDRASGVRIQHYADVDELIGIQFYDQRTSVRHPGR